MAEDQAWQIIEDFKANAKDIPPEPAPDGPENRNDSLAGEGWSSSDC